MEQPICIAGTITITRNEAKDQALLKAKIENLKQAAIRTMITEVEKRGWGVVEYMENTAR